MSSALGALKGETQFVDPNDFRVTQAPQFHFSNTGLTRIGYHLIGASMALSKELNRFLRVLRIDVESEDTWWNLPTIEFEYEGRNGANYFRDFVYRISHMEQTRKELETLEEGLIPYQDYHYSAGPEYRPVIWSRDIESLYEFADQIPAAPKIDREFAIRLKKLGWKVPWYDNDE